MQQTVTTSAQQFDHALATGFMSVVEDGLIFCVMALVWTLILQRLGGSLWRAEQGKGAVKDGSLVPMMLLCTMGLICAGVTMAIYLSIKIGIYGAFNKTFFFST